MAYGWLNDDVIDDLTWPWKVKVVIPISLRPIISKTARDRDSGTTGHAPIGNGTRGIESSRDRWRYMTRQMPCWFHNRVFEYSFNTRTRAIRDLKTRQFVPDRLIVELQSAGCWFLYKKKLQMAIPKIPGNSRGNFWVVKFPGIPEREFPVALL